MNNKLAIGIVVGLLAALGIGFVAYKAGQQSSSLPPQPAETVTQNSSTTDLSKPVDIVKEVKLPAGQVKITGTFRDDVPGLFPVALTFKTTTTSEIIPANTGFYFSNYDYAHSLLKIGDAGKLGSPGCDFISGQAEIIVSDYKPQNTKQSESVNTAKLISVSKILSPAKCGRNATN